MGIPSCNHWELARYEAELASLGVSDVEVTSLGGRVLAHWLPSALCRHLDYVCVAARVGAARGGGGGAAGGGAAAPKKLKVAVIGSGLAGLTTAHELVSSGRVEVAALERPP